MSISLSRRENDGPEAVHSSARFCRPFLRFPVEIFSLSSAAPNRSDRLNGGDSRGGLLRVFAVSEHCQPLTAAEPRKESSSCPIPLPTTRPISTRNCPPRV